MCSGGPGVVAGLAHDSLTIENTVQDERCIEIFDHKLRLTNAFFSFITVQCSECLAWVRELNVPSVAGSLMCLAWVRELQSQHPLSERQPPSECSAAGAARIGRIIHQTVCHQ